MKTKNRNLPKPPRRKNRGNWSVPAVCPGCSKAGMIEERMIRSTQLIRDEEIECDVKKWVCAGCSAAFMSPKQATDAAKRAIAIYQMKHGLLTAEEIREGRKKKELSVEELADEADLGVATIKRLEAGSTVQRPSTNTLLLTVFNEEHETLPDYQITLDSKNFAAACSAIFSKWAEQESWNPSDPWSASAQFDASCDYAADSNTFAFSA